MKPPIVTRLPIKNFFFQSASRKGNANKVCKLAVVNDWLMLPPPEGKVHSIGQHFTPTDVDAQTVKLNLTHSPDSDKLPAS